LLVLGICARPGAASAPCVTFKAMTDQHTGAQGAEAQGADAQTPDANDNRTPFDNALRYKTNCPKCSAGTLRPSRLRGWRDRLAGMIGLSPYRCGRCNVRVYRWRAP